MIVAVDNREQAPYNFTRIPRPKAGRRKDDGDWLNVMTETQHLKEGDYSIVGTDQLVAVERKSLQDLYGTLANGRDQFKAEIERLLPYETAAVVIEASWDEIIRPSHYHSEWRSRLEPRSVFGTILSWGGRYPNVHWYPCGDRRLAEITAYEILAKAWKRATGKIDELVKEKTKVGYSIASDMYATGGNLALASVANLMLQNLEVPF